MPASRCRPDRTAPFPPDPIRRTGVRTGAVAAAAFSVWLATASPARAQTPDDALAAALPAVCAGAVPASELAARCGELSAGGPGALQAVAAGNVLGEIPGQGRVATRDGTPEDGAPATELAAGWSLVASADVGWQDRRAGGNEAAFDGDSASLAAGVDWRPADDWQLGLLLNHARDQLRFDGSGGRLRSRFSGVLAVAGWQPHAAWSLDAYAGRLRGGMEVRRVIEYVLPGAVAFASRATATADSDRELAGIGATWSAARGAWNAQLGAGVDWQRTTIAPYGETGGGGFTIAAPGREVVSRRGRVDATLARTVSRGWGVVQPFASAGWRREYANAARPLTVRFLQDAAGTPVTFATDDPDTTWGEVAAGATFVFAGGHSAFIEWRQRMAHDFLDERLLAIGWRMELP